MYKWDKNNQLKYLLENFPKYKSQTRITKFEEQLQIQLNFCMLFKDKGQKNANILILITLSILLRIF